MKQVIFIKGYIFNEYILEFRIVFFLIKIFY